MSKRAFLRVGSKVFVTLAAFAFCTSLLLFFREFTRSAREQDEQSRILEARFVSFGEMEEHEQRIFYLRFKNHESRAVRIVGFDGSCTLHGCVSVNVKPMVVEAYEEKLIPYQISSRAPGAFTATGQLYVNNAGLLSFPFEFSGKIISRRNDLTP